MAKMDRRKKQIKMNAEHLYKYRLTDGRVMYTYALSFVDALAKVISELDPKDPNVDVAYMVLGNNEANYTKETERELLDRERAYKPKPQMFKVKLYRRDSETPVEYENVKHVWRDNRGCVIVAQYTNPPEPEHHYFTWPLELISHYRTDRQN